MQTTLGLHSWTWNHSINLPLPLFLNNKCVFSFLPFFFLISLQRIWFCLCFRNAINYLELFFINQKSSRDQSWFWIIGYDLTLVFHLISLAVWEKIKGNSVVHKRRKKGRVAFCCLAWTKLWLHICTFPLTSSTDKFFSEKLPQVQICTLLTRSHDCLLTWIHQAGKGYHTHHRITGQMIRVRSVWLLCLVFISLVNHFTMLILVWVDGVWPSSITLYFTFKKKIKPYPNETWPVCNGSDVFIRFIQSSNKSIHECSIVSLIQCQRRETYKESDQG